MKQDFPSAGCSDVSLSPKQSAPNLQSTGTNSLIHRFVDDNQELPHEFVLHSNHPTPAHPKTTIRFGLPESSTVRLMLYNVVGQRVKILVDGLLSAGMHEVVFEANDLPAGTYLCHLKTPEGNFVKKLLLTA